MTRCRSLSSHGLAALTLLAASPTPANAIPAPAAQLDHPDRAAILARMRALDAIHVLPIPALTQRANGGDLRAMYALSLRYQNGLDVKRSWAEYERLSKRILQLAPAAAAQGDAYALYMIALQGWLIEGWSDARKFVAYRAAAEAGDPEAADGVAFAYYWGRGVRVDKAEALRWYLRASVAGHCEAIRMVGTMLSDPKDDAFDVAEGARWYRIAAENRYACGNGASYALALIYSEGAGNVPRDYAQALHWFLETAKRGNPVGAMQIGFYYEKGLGTPVNKAEALKWFRLAGFSSVAAARAELARLGVKEPG